jgi:hypothetical protein
MSEDHAFFSGSLPQPVRQAQVFMERRGQQLSATALRVLAREVILRVSRIEAPVVPVAVRPATSEIDALCDALLSHDDEAGAEMVRTARMAGMPADVLYHAYHRRGRAPDWPALGPRRGIGCRSHPGCRAGLCDPARPARRSFLAEHLVAPPWGRGDLCQSVPGEVHGIGADDCCRYAAPQGLGHHASAGVGSFGAGRGNRPAEADDGRSVDGAIGDDLRGRPADRGACGCAARRSGCWSADPIVDR